MNERTQSKKGIFQAKSAKLVRFKVVSVSRWFSHVAPSHHKTQKMLCKTTVKFLFILKGILKNPEEGAVYGLLTIYPQIFSH